METRSAETLANMLTPLTNYVRRRLRDHEALGDVAPADIDVEGIVDQTYLAAGQRLQQQAVVASERGYRWLRAIAHELLERAVRRARGERWAAGVGNMAIARSLPELVPEPNSPIADELAADAEFQRALARLLGQLPDALREPFLLVVADGFSINQVAALEQLAPEEVRRRVAAAGVLLRELLADLYVGGEDVPLERLFWLVERCTPSAAAHLRACQSLAVQSEATSPRWG